MISGQIDFVDGSDVQKSVSVKLARLLPDIAIGCCFDSRPRIDSVLQRPGFRYGLLENAIEPSELHREGVFPYTPRSEPSLSGSLLNP